MLAKLLIVFPLIVAPLRAQTPSQSFENFDGYVAQSVRDWRVPGLAIAVVKDNRVVFAKGYGVRQVGTSDLVTENTLFANASTTKAFVTMAAAMLVDQNRLDWDDPVIKHLPTFRVGDGSATENLTVRHLFSHRTGFGDPSYLWYGIPNQLDTMLGRLRYTRRASGWTTGYAYNNVTFSAGGAVIATVTGEDWENAVRDHILTPLGMHRTVTNTDHAEEDDDIAMPHDILADSVRVIERYRTDNIGAAGAMYSSVWEMTNWLRFLLDSGRVRGERLIGTDTFGELFEPQVLIDPDDFYPTTIRTKPNFTAYGLGWFLQDYRGEKVAFHTGSIDGMVAIVGLIPSKRLGVVVFANLDHAEVRHALMLRIFDMYLGSPVRDWNAELLTLYDSLAGPGREAALRFAAARDEDAGPSHALESYVGEYRHRLYGTARVSMRNGSLILSRSHFLVADLNHWHYDVFRAEWHRPWITSRTVSFDLNRNGNVSGLEIDGFRLEKRE